MNSYGFCKGSSSLQSLLKFFEQLLEGCHNMPGFPKVVTESLAWISHWLNCRKSTINEQTSQWRNVKSGVLQVLLLASMLFNIFVCNLGNNGF